MAQRTTPFLLNLSSDLDEPNVSNDEFLDSLDRIGVWLRVLAAYDSLERYASPESTTIQRLAALSNIYLQLGAQLEDQAVSLVAFSVWSKNRELVLADLFSRIFVRRALKSADGSEIQRVHAKLEKSPKAMVPVDPRAFFREVAEMPGAESVEFFLGYRWRPVPSVKLIPKRHIAVWDALPEEFRRIAISFYDEAYNPRIAAAYNKLKHGPQIVVQNPVERAKCYGSSPDLSGELARYDAIDKPSVRLLFAGARTRYGLTDSAPKSAAPFLIDHEGAAKQLFFETMVHHANLVSTLVKMQIAIYKGTPIELGNLDEGVARIVKAMGHYWNFR